MTSAAAAQRARASTTQGPVTPTAVEIAWVAGFYEGEGWCGPKVGGKGSLRASIVQNETWPLERIQRIYGGGIYPRRTYLNGKWFSGHVLQLSSVPARQLLQDALPHLSPRRRAQAQVALNLRPPRPRATADHCVHGHPWAEFGVLDPRRGWRFCRACKRESERMRYRSDDDRRRSRLKRDAERRRSKVPALMSRPERMRTECRRGHAFTPENTIWNSRRGRQCRACWCYYRAKARSRKPGEPGSKSRG